MSTIVSAGDRAPEFTLEDQDGKKHTLAENKGSYTLLYFYPKDDTPGCTKETCAIRDNLPRFKALKAAVFGVSVDSVKSHKKFAEKYGVPFTLLADTEKTVVKQYGVWALKKFMGREYYGTVRTSFLIDPKGVIAKVYTAVKPETHADEVVEDLKKIQNKK